MNASVLINIPDILDYITAKLVISIYHTLGSAVSYLLYESPSPSTTVDFLQLHTPRTFSKHGNRQLSYVL